MPTAPGQADSSQPPAQLQDRYRLVQWLGEGSMGLVYRARDERLDRDVAVKFLLPGRLGGDEAGSRFLREARTVARLSHPNIVTLYDAGREQDWLYLVLEYIPGQDLHARMLERGGPLDLPEALHVARGVLEALAYAHAQGVIHRDVKPENVMCTPDGQVKVTDFGLALARGDVRLTREGALVGTVLYLAPESIAGAGVDQRADLYAVGALLYEMLAGRPPFFADDPMAVLGQILHAPLTPPRALNPAIPPPVEQFLLRLLARDPALRCASAGQALAELPAAETAGKAGTAPARERPAASGSSSLLERIVRGSSAVRQREPAGPAEPPGEEAHPLPQELLVYAAHEDLTAAIEVERRRLARLLQHDVIEPLNLLLAQARAYEQPLSGNPQARMAVSVLSSLARQALQQTRDLEDALHPGTLESLGLEPALEALASQARRAHGLEVDLDLERLAERLPLPVELAFFRLAQEALDRAVYQAHAGRLGIRLECQPETLCLEVSDDGVSSEAGATLQAARQRIEQLGGSVELARGDPRGLRISARLALQPPVHLTPREVEVLQLLVEGLSNKEIGRALHVTPRTVNFHLDNVYAKLGVRSRTEAAIYALRHGLLLPGTADTG